MPAGPDQPSSGRLAGGEHLFPVRVYYEDTDLAGVVYHANYLRFMERARSELLNLVGIDQRGAFEAGEGVFAVTELAIRYRRPARFADELRVVSRIVQVRAAGLVIQQRVMRADEILADADVTVVLVAPNGRSRRQPRAWIDIFERLKDPSPA